MDQNQTQPQNQSTPKQQIVESVREATNVLVTVKSNPSVDELASVIGLTLMLNKIGKHATAVFSGQVPSTLEFLKPEETIETNTDSLRDFIISLDKSKADKLRYKVEDNVVKIYITPYRTSISDKDLEFAQGDFNIDAVIALGVTQRDELDNVITAHGKILHDATFITITAGQDHTEIGQINWQEGAASSLSEMLVSISEAFGAGLIDEQIATAFLTGIVAETERFSNPKTTPKVMTMSAQLMASGANQQLIANELEKAVEVSVSDSNAGTTDDFGQKIEQTESSNGVLSIDHNVEEQKFDEELSQPNSEAEEESTPPTGVDLADILNETSDSEKDADVKPPSESEGSHFLGEEAADEDVESVNPLMSNQGEAASPDLNSILSGISSTADDHQEEGENGGSILPPPPDSEHPEDDNQIHIDQHGNMMRKAAISPKHKSVQPLSGDLHDGGVLPQVESSTKDEETRSKFPPPPEIKIDPPSEIQDTTTLLELEKSVNSPHVTPGDPGSAPLQAPTEQSNYDAYRLPGADGPTSHVTDVTGNLPPEDQPSETDEGGDMKPPPVPPPMVGI